MPFNSMSSKSVFLSAALSLSLFGCGNAQTSFQSNAPTGPVQAAPAPPSFTTAAAPVSPPRIQGRIAFLSDRNNHIPVNQTAPWDSRWELSLYVRQDNRDYLISTDNLSRNMDLNHRFISGNRIGYRGSDIVPAPEENDQLAIYYSSLDHLEQLHGAEPPRIQVQNSSTLFTTATLPNDFSRWTLSSQGILAIAYFNGTLRSDLVLGKSDGSDLKNITADNLHYQDLDFSPDGSQLLSVQTDLHESPLYTRMMLHSLNGDKPQRLAEQALDPHWSPNGRRILYTALIDNTLQLMVMDADGQNSLQLTHGPKHHFSGKWSPNGEKIVYGESGVMPINDSERSRNSEEIYVINADGSRNTNLTQNKYQDSDPVWSPDGSQIAFCTNRDGNQEVYVMNADGSQPYNLTQNPARDFRPVWGD